MSNKFTMALLCLFLLAGCTSLTPEEYVGEQVGLELPEAVSVEQSDSHGGFHGDGLRLNTLVFSPEDGQEIEEQITGRGDVWNEGPFDEYLGGILYDGGPAEEGGWPRNPARCWWFFWDRQQDQDTPLDERHSWNYTAALYDGDTCTLYYLKFDT